MFKWIFNIFCFIFIQISSAFAEAGNLFIVDSNGTGNDISITLCLNINGKNALSCQNYNTKSGTLTLHTTIPHQTYLYAGIKINTPGYVFHSPTNTNGYSLIGAVSDTQSATVTVVPVISSLSLTSTSSSHQELGITYLQTNTASGGTPPYTFSLNSGALPTWNIIKY